MKYDMWYTQGLRPSWCGPSTFRRPSHLVSIPSLWCIDGIIFVSFASASTFSSENTQRTQVNTLWEHTQTHCSEHTQIHQKTLREHSPHLRLQDTIFITCQLPPAPCCNHLLGRFRGLTTLQWGAPAAGVIFLFLFSHHYLSRFSILFGNCYKSLRLTSVEKSMSPVTPVSSWTKRTINWRGISSPSKASLSARTDTSTSTWSRWWSLPNWHFILSFSVQSSGKIPPQGRRKR